MLLALAQLWLVVTAGALVLLVGVVAGRAVVSAVVRARRAPSPAGTGRRHPLVVGVNDG